MICMQDNIIYYEVLKGKKTYYCPIFKAFLTLRTKTYTLHGETGCHYLGNSYSRRPSGNDNLKLTTCDNLKLTTLSLG